MKRSEFKQLVRRELIKEAKGTSYESKLAEIEKQGKMVTLEAKIDALSEMIETKNNRLSLVNEDENLADLVDKKKIKEMQKEIKLLEKAKTKMEKVFEKMGGVRTEVTSGDTVEAGMTEDTSDQVAADDAEDAAEEASEGLGENLTSEHQGYDDKEDESLGMEDGPEKDYTQSEKDRREDRYGKWGDRDEEHRGASLEESTNEEYNKFKTMGTQENKEYLRMQKLAGIISEEEYKNRLNEQEGVFGGWGSSDEFLGDNPSFKTSELKLRPKADAGKTNFTHHWKLTSKDGGKNLLLWVTVGDEPKILWKGNVDESAVIKFINDRKADFVRSFESKINNFSKEELGKHFTVGSGYEDKVTDEDIISIKNGIKKLSTIKPQKA